MSGSPQTPSPAKRRTPLAEGNPNVQAKCTFSPVSKGGRQRRITEKGAENFRIL
jgi:hypothetical protein